MKYTLAEVLAIAKGQRAVLWCILGNIVCFLFFMAIGAVLPEEIAGFVVLPFFLGFIALVIAQIAFIYRLSCALRKGIPVLWTIGVLIPVLSLVIMLVLSSEATRAIRAEGFKVGLMGADTDEIEARLATQPTPQSGGGDFTGA